MSGEVDLIKDGGRKGRGAPFRSAAQLYSLRYFAEGRMEGGGRCRGEVHWIRDGGIEGGGGGFF